MSSIERTAPEFPVATTPAPGVMGVDWEQRVDFERLRRYRLERARACARSAPTSARCSSSTPRNIRYLTATHIGYWAFNKMERWALLTRTGEPWIWDFGSAARVHKLQAPWLDPTHSVGGNTGLAGSIGPESGLVARAVREIRDVLEDEGVASMPLGIDMAETEMFLELTRAGIDVRNGQQVMLRGSRDQEPRRDHAADAGSGDGRRRLPRHLRSPETRNPRVRHRRPRQQAALRDGLRARRSDQLDRRRTVQPPSARVLRSADPARRHRVLRHHPGLQRVPDLLLPNIRRRPRDTAPQRDAYKRAREWIDAAIALVKPGTGTDEIAEVWPDAQEFGFPDEMEAFGLQFGHGVGLSVHERPVISRLNSFETPIELEEGMFFALETFCPAADGRSAARIEEQVICTAEGPHGRHTVPCRGAPRRQRVLILAVGDGGSIPRSA